MPPGYPTTNGASTNGNGNGTAPPSRRPKEAIAGMVGSWGGGYVASWGEDSRPIVLPHAFDDVTRDYRVETYEWMMCDPVVCSSVTRIKQSVLAGGVRIGVSDKLRVKPGEDATPEQERAEEVRDWVQGQVDRMETPLADVLNEMLDCLVYGHVLAEIVYADGLVDGKRALRDVKPKPLHAYHIVVDPFGNILGIKPANWAGLRPPDQLIEREHFVLMTWGKKRGDPRGRSILRPAYKAWNDKRQLVTDYLQYAKRFASPAIVGRFVPIDGPAGKTWDTTASSSGTTALEELIAALEPFRNGSVLGLGPGRDVEVFEAVGNGEAFLKGFEHWDRQIATAIAVSPRSIMEAEHGSKADAEVASRNPDALAEFIADKVGRVFEWDLFYGMVRDAFGDSEADQYTPCLEVGASEQQDIPGEMAVAVSAGYTLDPSQFEALDARLGMPERAEGWDDVEPMDGGGGFDEDGNPIEPGPGPDGEPATFAAAPMPWDESDLRAARMMLRKALGSKSRLKRWKAGTLSRDERLAVLHRLVALAKGRLAADGEGLTGTLAAAAADSPAAFAVSDTLRTWRDGTALYLRRAYLAGALAVLGPEPNAADYAALRQANEAQVAYLDNFASEVSSGRQAIDGTLASRAAMYGASLWSVAQQVGRARAVAEGNTEERRVHVGSDTPCQGCSGEVAKAWQPIGSLKPIGGCECMSGCHCHFEFRHDDSATFARGGGAKAKAGGGVKQKGQASRKGVAKTHARTPGVCGPGGGAPCHKARAAKKAAVTPAQKARARAAASIVRRSAGAAKKAGAVQAKVAGKGGAIPPEVRPEKLGKMRIDPKARNEELDNFRQEYPDAKVVDIPITQAMRDKLAGHMKLWRTQPGELAKVKSILSADRLPPPIVQFHASGNVGFPDGFHRVAAYIIAGRTSIRGYAIGEVPSGVPKSRATVKPKPKPEPEVSAAKAAAAKEGRKAAAGRMVAKSKGAVEKASAQEVKDLETKAARLGNEHTDLVRAQTKALDAQAKLLNPYVEKGKAAPPMVRKKAEELQNESDTLYEKRIAVKADLDRVQGRLVDVALVKAIGSRKGAAPGSDLPATPEGIRPLFFNAKGKLKGQAERRATLSEHVRLKQGPAAAVKEHGMTKAEDLRSFEYDGIAYRTANPTHSADLIHNLATRPDPFPKELTRHTKEVVFSTQKNSGDPHWEKEYNTPGFAAAATGGRGKVVVYNGNGMNSFLFAHETGHNLAQGRYASTDPTRTRDFALSDYHTAMKSGEKPVSAYAAKSPAEDFAEATKMYATEPLILAKIAPKRYAILDKLIKDPKYAG